MRPHPYPAAPLARGSASALASHYIQVPEAQASVVWVPPPIAAQRDSSTSSQGQVPCQVSVLKAGVS